MRYARIENNAVVEVRNMPENFDPAAVAHKFDWRPFTALPAPPFDEATHKLDSIEYTIFADRVEGQRTVVALTQGEIDEAAEQAQFQQDAAIAKAKYASLKDGSATVQDVKNILAHLLKKAYYNDV